MELVDIVLENVAIKVDDEVLDNLRDLNFNGRKLLRCNLLCVVREKLENVAQPHRAVITSHTLRLTFKIIL